MTAAQQRRLTALANDGAPLWLPRILCLHGGGVNAEVFRLQCRAIISRLDSKFRFVFVDAPFESAPHDAIASFYGNHAPFFRWLRWKPDHPEIEGKTAAARIMEQCKGAIDADPGTGKWVGILGFSQGARIAASLLWALERMTEGPHPAPVLRDVKFGVIMAGSGPIVMLDGNDRSTAQYLSDAGLLSTEVRDLPDDNNGDHALGLPTLHVHGLRDDGLERQRILLNKYCKEGTAKLVEWDGGHRVTIKPPDVTMVVDKILELAREAGIKWPAIM